MVFDSGIGGLGTLCEIEKSLPNEEFVFVADFQNSPYGNKTKKQIKDCVLTVLKKYVKKFEPKCLVVACNTATAVCIDEIRKTFDGVFCVGCEPAVKVAQKEGKTRILVLCTKATRKYSAYLKKQKNIVVFCPQKLATLIDNNFLCEETIIVYLNKCLKKFYKKFDAVILGCTHYVLFKKEIEKIVGCKTYEGNSGISKHISKNVAHSKTKGKVHLISTTTKKEQFLIDCHQKIKGEKICVE